MQVEYICTECKCIKNKIIIHKTEKKCKLCKCTKLINNFDTNGKPAKNGRKKYKSHCKNCRSVQTKNKQKKPL